jgi:hypothetical protein
VAIFLREHFSGRKLIAAGLAVIAVRLITVL